MTYGKDDIMDKKPVQGQLPMGKEAIVLERGVRPRYRFFAAFLICSALLLAAFAVSAVWMQTEHGEQWFAGLGSFLGGKDTEPPLDGAAPSVPSNPIQEPTAPQAPIEIPEGATPIKTVDLSRPDLGNAYIHNQTAYDPDIEALLSMPLERATNLEQPVVLILHTHTSEAYLPSGMSYVEGAVGDAVYSREDERGVLAVGQVLCQLLNEKGIPTVHCTVIHDDPTLSGSYARSAETVKRYLTQYPGIRYVIDLHRDSVTTAAGELIRSVGDGSPDVAQVLAVVGSDGNGTKHERWEDNLALALQLRELLNRDCPNVCRPVSLRNASYYQELARYSLILEIGTCANSVEEAKRAATFVADALAELIYLR